MPSVRGLKDSGFGTPLLDFNGTLEDIEEVPVPVSENNTRAFVKNNLKFTEVEVIESSEPYDLPVATVSISASGSKASRWGIFATSVVRFLSDDEDIDSLKGKSVHMQITPGHKQRQLNKDTNKWDEVDIEAWEVVGVDGNELGSIVAGSTAAAPKAEVITAATRAKELLDGKTAIEFFKVAYVDPVIKKDAAIIGQINSKTFIPALLQAGEFAKDAQGVYHKVG